jgi:hypothetical protein
MRGRTLNFMQQEKRFSEQENWPFQQTWHPDHHPQYCPVLLPTPSVLQGPKTGAVCVKDI